MSRIIKGKPLHPPHPAVRTATKTASVDRKILPVVKWLNGFDGIHTRHSCQGTDDRDRPYVVFHCDDPLTLVRVLAKVRHFAHVEVEWYPEACGLRYVARFDTPAHLADFVRMEVP